MSHIRRAFFFYCSFTHFVVSHTMGISYRGLQAVCEMLVVDCLAKIVSVDSQKNTIETFNYSKARFCNRAKYF